MRYAARSVRILFRSAQVIDGTGADAFRADVLVEDETIAEVGEVSLSPDEVVDARGLTLAPGFIDAHSHADFTLPGDPDAWAKVAQGITTEVVGNCGLGLSPANERVERFYEQISPVIFGEPGGGCFEDLIAYRKGLEDRGVAVNVACLIPHGNVRCAVMGLDERAPSTVELAHMETLVAEGMAQGAFGLSTGLVYAPGAYAETEELIALARVAGEAGGIYASHLRDEGTKLVESVQEALTIGERARLPVQLSHHKAAGRFNWGKVGKTLRMVDEARAKGQRVHGDVYPYTAGSTLLSALFLPLWAFEGSQAQLLERLGDPATRAHIIEDAKARIAQFVTLPGGLDRVVPKKILLPIILRGLSKLVVISSCKRQHVYEGKTLDEVRRMRGQPLFEALLDLLLEEETAVATIVHVMREEDVRTVLSHRAIMVGSDGFPQREGKPHPRTYGTFPRVLDHYVRELGLLALPEAIHKMTGLTAQAFGLDDRGTIAIGKKADLVLFETGGVRDHATYETPRRRPDGIRHVMVNGQFTVRDGEATGARPGRVLSKRGAGA